MKARRIAPGHVLARAVDHAPQCAAAGLFGKSRPGIEGAVIAEAVEEIGNQDEITLAGKALGHGIEGRARPEGIHVEDDAGRSAVGFALGWNSPALAVPSSVRMVMSCLAKMRSLRRPDTSYGTNAVFQA